MMRAVGKRPMNLTPQFGLILEQVATYDAGFRLGDANAAQIGRTGGATIR